ncbi:MAG TPA: acyl-CoA carboxylase subunit epsilon [Pseudolysinimonas sp.]|nr:acyl-CoA carboxylase subunit epsilon [Pseudolysinimonas sp.]
MTDITPQIRVLSGNPDPQELAAVTAVLTGALAELAQNERRQHDNRPDGWMRSQRSLRSSLTVGTWRTFGL